MRKMDKRNLIEIQHPVFTANDFGEQENTWTTYATIYAAIQGLSGREYIINDVKNAEVNYRIFTEFIDGVKPTDRVKFGDRYFAIVSVVNLDELNRELQLLCKEVIS